MPLTKEFMIQEIKKHKDKDGNPYHSMYITGGRTELENAPEKNIYGFYRSLCLTGRKDHSNIVRI